MHRFGIVSNRKKAKVELALEQAMKYQREVV